MKNKKKNIKKTKDISQDVWTIHIPPIPAKLVSAAKERNIYLCTENMNADNYIKMKIKLQQAEDYLEEAESMKKYCIDLIQKIKYTFDLTTAKIKDLADDLLCGQNDFKEEEYKTTSLARIVNCVANLQDYCNRIVYSLRDQIELQNVHLKKFSIQKLLKDTISSLKEIAEDREISLSYNVQDNINDIVIGDSCLLQSILSQLISSGAIRVNKSCQVDVIVMLFIAPYRKANEKDRILRFIVRDNVKGISQDKLQEINAKFTDLHSIRDPEILDSSLGFANYIVNKLSGKLEIKSEAKWNLIITLPSKL
ncbi:sensor histidine kinase [Orientia tsutsugamushi]|uniref:sensor histidine kinase n=1 Tax=Orientia tsutsugamushi TaxID=784 RepID=UPI001CC240F7|nr:sensor histidine kinase [Orientia tsutsugamushi]